MFKLQKSHKTIKIALTGKGQYILCFLRQSITLYYLED